MKILDSINKINVYNLMIFNLIIFSIVGIFILGWKNTLPQLVIAVLTAGSLDSIFNYFKTKQLRIYKSGVISGFFIGLVLSNSPVWYVPLIAAILAILIKHLTDYIMNSLDYNSHIFNPAMSGIFISILLFKTSDGWWGAISFFPIFILGLFLLYKFKRFGLSIPFLITYFLIIGATAFIKGSFSYLLFFNFTLYFFAFFMLIEPRTSPVTSRGRLFYGIIAGIIIALMHLFLPVYELTLGLLISNLFVPFINKIYS